AQPHQRPSPTIVKHEFLPFPVCPPLSDSAQQPSILHLLAPPAPPDSAVHHPARRALIASATPSDRPHCSAPLPRCSPARKLIRLHHSPFAGPWLAVNPENDP